MRIFGLADLHLGESVDKPMDIFGPVWERHAERIDRNWRARVGADDWVLVPGDISWAMKLEDALTDLRFIDALPGRKILLKGNHDYWWTSRGKVEAVLPLRSVSSSTTPLTSALGSASSARGAGLPPKPPAPRPRTRRSTNAS